MPSMQRVAAAVLVVELGLGDRVVDVDGREEQRAFLHHVVETQHAGRGLLGDALDLTGDRGPALLGLGERGVEDVEDDLLLVALGRGRVRRDAGLLHLDTEVDQHGRVATVVEDHVGARLRSIRALGPHEDLLGAPPVLLQRSRPSRRRPGTPAGLSTVPVGPTATAAAAWSWVEKMLQDAQRTSAPSAVSVSMSTAVWIVMCREPAIRAPGERLGVAVALPHRHQAGHLVLGERDLGTAEVGQERSATLKSMSACS